MKRIGFIFLMVALLSSTLAYRPDPVQAEPAAPTDTPEVWSPAGSAVIP